MRRKRDNEFPDNGFEAWGGYMNAKIAKLDDQYADKASNENNRSSNIFNGISIFVNGYTKPSADQLKCLMSEHGGIYHHYFRTSKTNFIIASNLPDTKVKNLPTTKIVKPEWISESIKAAVLLNYKEYLLYNNQSKTQPRLQFKNNNSTNQTDDTSDISSECHVKRLFDDTDDNKDNESDVLNTVDSKVIKESITNHTEKPTNKDNASVKTAVDPKFLGEFYNNSRLHHISQLGAGFKQYVNELRNGSDFSFPLRNTLKKQKTNHQETIADEKINDHKVIMHIDMDCFFVSVGLRNNPQLRGQPVAVTHAKNTGRNTEHSREGVDRQTEFEMYRQKKRRQIMKSNINMDPDIDEDFSSRIKGIGNDGEKFGSMSEIASCSYEARALGLHNGMFMGPALRLCPHLKTIPYDFEGYKEVAFMLYDTVAQYTLDIEAVSCDEMYVDCTDLLQEVGLEPLEFASVLRDEIKKKTRCPCSVGFGENRLQARLATKKAKPDGQFYLNSDEAESYFADVPLCDLPGVGRQMQYKLKALGFTTCQSLWTASLTMLQKQLGNKTGQLLYNFCRGKDNRSLNFNAIRKSISAGVNYGIRFTDKEKCETFLRQLCQEVHNRMRQNKVIGKSITLKLMVRAADAPVETAKFMGHGICDNITKTSNLTDPTDDLDIITKEVLDICMKLNIKPEEMRGIGIQISKLESLDNKEEAKRGGIEKFFNKNAIKSQVKIINSPIKENVSLNNQARTDLDKNKSNALNKNNTVEKEIPIQNTELKTTAGSNKIANLGIVKRRGRPPKSSTVNKVHSMIKNDSNNFFNKNTDNKKPSETNAFYEIETLDEDVLNALPEDIRNEVLANYKHVKKVQPSSNKTEGPKNENSYESHIVNNHSNNEPKKGESDSNKSESLDILNLHWKEIQNMSKVWIDSGAKPLDYDIKLVCIYLQNLIVNKRIEDAYHYLKFFFRKASTTTDCDWHEVYRKMVDNVQESMLAVYEKRMALFEKFTCCHKAT